MIFRDPHRCMILLLSWELILSLYGSSAPTGSHVIQTLINILLIGYFFYFYKRDPHKDEIIIRNLVLCDSKPVV